jgi:hypothetical protein
MSIWSKALAVALSATLMGFGATAVQAKGHKDYDSCHPKTCEPPPPPPMCCPAPVIQTPTINSTCCELPVVQPRCPTGCAVNSKEFNKAEKEAFRTQKDALKARNKQQKAIAKAQHELEEKTAQQQRRIDKATDHLNHEANELVEANAKYEAFFGGPSEAVAAATPEPQPEPEPVIIRSKPEPEPIAEAAPQPAPVVEEQQVVLLEPTPAPVTEPAPVEKPKELPRTASPLSLIGLIGLLSMSGYATRFFR